MAIAFYIKGAEGTVEGPFSAQTLKKKASQGEISDSTGIRKGTDGPWIPARRVGGLLGSGPREEPASPLRLGAAPDAAQPPVLFTPTGAESQDDEIPLLEEDRTAPSENSPGDSGFDAGPSTWTPSASSVPGRAARDADETEDSPELPTRSSTSEKVCLVVSVLGGIAATISASLGFVLLVMALFSGPFITSLPIMGLAVSIACCTGLMTMVVALAARTLIGVSLATAELRRQQLGVLQSVEQRLAALVTSQIVVRSAEDDSAAGTSDAGEMSASVSGSGR